MWWATLALHFASWSETAPFATACGLVALIAAWILVLIPSTPIELAVAYAYGLRSGFVIVYSGKVLGSLASFAVGRALSQSRRSQWLTRQRLLRACSLACEREPWRICFLARAAYIPIAIKNYGFAALAAPPLPFASALVSVEIYNTAVAVSVAVSVHKVGDAVSRSGSHDGEDQWVSAIGTAIAATCLVGFGCYGGSAVRRELDQLQRDEQQEGESSPCFSRTARSAVDGSLI